MIPKKLNFPLGGAGRIVIRQQIWHVHSLFFFSLLTQFQISQITTFLFYNKEVVERDCHSRNHKQSEKKKYHQKAGQRTSKQHQIEQGKLFTLFSCLLRTIFLPKADNQKYH